MTDQTAPAIEVRQLHKRFGDQVVIKNVDLRVGAGETVAVMGRSGTGKSVLLKLIVGLQKPDSGSIQIHGQDITTMTPEQLAAVRMKVGFVFQDAALYDSLTLEENVAFPLERRRDMKPEAIRDRVRELLDLVGMADDLRKKPSEISGGMKKRVGLARALALNPDVLLFDEPTAGLDPITAGEIEQLVLKLRERQQTASLVVTHDLHGAKTIGTRFVFIDAGTILVDGGFDQLTASDNPVVSAFLKNAA